MRFFLVFLMRFRWFVNESHLACLSRSFCATITHVKNNFSISPMRPKLFKECPWTSQIALNRQAFPFIPKVDNMSSAVPYSKARSPPWNAFFGTSDMSRLCSLRLMNAAMKSAIIIPACRLFSFLSKAAGRAP